MPQGRNSMAMSAVDPYILRLPDEPLDKILGLLAETRRDVLPPILGYENAESLALVCRRFNKLVTPYLYSSLYLNFSTDEAYGWYPHEEDLQWTLEQKPALRPLCRSLVIEHGTKWRYRKPSEFLPVAMDLVTWLTATKSLDISTYGDPLTLREAWSIASRAIEVMHDLTELRFRNRWPYCNIPLSMFIEDIENIGPNLRLLELHGISELGDSKSWRKLDGLAGKGSITDLRLFGFWQTPQVLTSLVAWAAKLERFTFRCWLQSGYGVPDLTKDWSLYTMRRVLNTHKSTLRSIEISHLNIGGLDKFELSSFTCLEHLSLSQESTGTDVNHIANLYIPSLCSFHWDMTKEGQQGGETLDSFGQEHEDWLRAFVDVYVKSKSNLRNITITFTPELWVRGSNQVIYPWDRMDIIAEEIKAYGMDLSYNPPTTTREQFLKWYGDKQPDQYPSPLWQALETQRNDVFERLLITYINDGGDIKSKRDGQTLLHAAVDYRNVVAADWLLTTGAEVNARRSQHGETPLLVAARQNNVAIVQLLLKNGAGLELGDADGRTPLMAAAISGAHETLQQLLDSGANFNGRDELSGKTPLIWATENNHLGIIVRLLDKGADRSITDRELGQTPLEWAVKLGHDDILKVLE